ncbi:MAG: fibronectin type III domain-containing protein [Thermodesulfovibrionales bacterium]
MIASLSTARPYRRASSPLFAGFLITLALSLLLFTAPEAFSASTTLSWDAPTTNTDGSPLNDLAGYKVYYGTAPGSYSPPVTVGNVTSYTISGLSGGTYYFTVTAYDTAGNESSYSNEVSKSFTSQYTLTVSKTGTGTGTVTGTGISCGSDCSETYASGTIVTLTASAASGSQFGGGPEEGAPAPDSASRP